MKKLLMAVLCLLLAVSARAEGTDPAAQWLESQKADLVPAGVEAAAETGVYALTLADGREALSLCLTVEGNLRFGRYAQLTRTGLIDAESGEEIGLDAVFTDLDALQDFLDAYVEENVLDSLNTYLDASDLLPVPLDAVCMNEQGVTFHYPAERFQFFSGHAGAVQLQWYELRELVRFSVPDAPLPLLPGGDIAELLAARGSLTDPDLVTDGELYEFEDPALRGVQAIADAAGTVTAVRYSRFAWQGARPGMRREETEALLGAPDTAVALDETAAQYLRAPAGTCARYGADQLYYDESGALRLLELRLK